MADAVKKLITRVSVEGAAQSRAQLQEFARAGEQSMTRAGESARAFASGLDGTGRALNDNAPRMARFGEAFDVAEGKIKGTVRGINDVRGALALVAPDTAGATQGLGRLAGTIGNVADVAGTLATVFLRNPLGLVALGLSAATIAYATLREKTDQAAVSEEAYQKALSASGAIVETEIERQKRLAVERAATAGAAIEAGIQEQEAALVRLKVIREGILEAQRAGPLASNPEADFAQPLRDFDRELENIDQSVARASGRIDELRTRLRLVAPEAQKLGRSLEAVRSELAGFGETKPTGIEAIRADFERVKAVLDQGVAEGLRLTREEYEALLTTAAKRRDLGIAAALEEEALRARAATDALFASLQEVIDREQAAANARQRAGGDIETRIDAYFREADATRAGAEALALFRREQEEARIRGEAFQQALQAYPDDLDAVEGAVNRVVAAWRELKGAQDAAAPAKTDVEKLRESVDGLGAGFERAGRRSARALADMLFGLDKARFSAQQFLATLGADIAEGLIRKQITNPITEGLSSGLGDLFGSFFGGAADGAAFDGGRVTAYARGGVVDRPTFFPMRDGAGLMGEAGPEAILPLKRLGGGALGVRADVGGGGIRVVVNNNGTVAAPQRTQVSERRGSDGMREIEILIEDKVEAAIAGGRFDSSMRASYGARRAPKRT